MQPDLTLPIFLLFIPPEINVATFLFSAKFIAGGIFHDHEMNYIKINFYIITQ